MDLLIIDYFILMSSVADRTRSKTKGELKVETPLTTEDDSKESRVVVASSVERSEAGSGIMIAGNQLQGPYDCKDSWEGWKAEFRLSARLLKIQDDDKVVYLLKSLGQDNLLSVIEWTKPKAPEDMSMEELLKVLDENFGSIETLRSKRLRLLKFKKNPEDDWSEFCRSHEKALGACELSGVTDTREEIGVLSLLNAIEDEKLKQRLCDPEVIKKPLKELYKMIRTFELAKENVNTRPTNIFSISGKCYACGDKNHLWKDCKHRGSRCPRCKKQGHIESGCFKKAVNNVTTPDSESYDCNMGPLALL